MYATKVSIGLTGGGAVPRLESIFQDAGSFPCADRSRGCYHYDRAKSGAPVGSRDPAFVLSDDRVAST